MNSFSVWDQVQVSNNKHPRKGQAGVIHATNPATPDEVAVKFDADGVVAVVSVADLKRLG